MARDHRRLAAIVSLDVVGYSRLMGVDDIWSPRANLGTNSKLGELDLQRCLLLVRRKVGGLLSLKLRPRYRPAQSAAAPASGQTPYFIQCTS